LLVKEEEKFAKERERGSAAHSLLEVFRRLLVMEMEVVKLVVKVLVAKGRGGERERGEKGSASSRNEGGLVFLSILDPISSSLRPWKSNLFISKGRGTLCLLWCQILALDSTRKHPSHWLKVVMKMVGRVGHFRAVSSPLKPRSIQTAYTDV
jgi:hypothetical protein